MFLLTGIVTVTSIPLLIIPEKNGPTGSRRPIEATPMDGCLAMTNKPAV